jgi:hypothetical protein
MDSDTTAALLGEGFCPDAALSVPFLASCAILEGECDANSEIPVTIVFYGEYKNTERKAGICVVSWQHGRDLATDDPNTHLWEERAG